MTAEQLATKAGKAQLLGTPGKDPVRSMKAALARELKKSDASRIVAVGDDLWQLAATGADESAPATPAKKKKKTAAKAKPAESKAARSAAPAKKASTKKAASKKAEAKKTAAKKTKAKKAETPVAEVSEGTAVEVAEATDQDQAAAAVPAEPKRKRKSRRRRKEVETAVETAVSVPEAPEAAAEVQAAEPAEAAAEEEAAAVAEAPAAVEIPGADIGAEAAGEAPGKKRRNRRSRRKRRGNREEAAETVTAIEVTAVEAPAAEVTAEPEPEPISVEQLSDVLAPKEMPVRADVPVTPDEAEIQAIYGDELSGTEPGAAFAEYEDELTEDEDRPMSPEMVSTRPDRQKRERRRRRERQRGEVVAARPQPHKERAERPAPAPASAPVSQAPAPSAAEIATDIYWPGNRLAARATAVLHGAEQRTLRGKQLARLMTTRGLLAGSPDTTWPHLESALVHDEKSRVARGMRPRVTARGRGTFEAVAQVSDRELAASESALENAVATALAATHRALSRRLSALELPELERVAHVFLTTQGYDDIAWIKRSQRSSYAVAVAPGGLGELLVGVRAGSDPVDRGGVGELRVGVQAKKLASGILLAPSPLSDAARQELRRNGPSLSVLAGDGFVSALVRAGIGVTVAHITVPLIDDAFLSALAESE